MKTKLFYSVILIIISFVSFGQRNIVLSSYPKKVPDGKKWILTTNQETLIEVDYGVLKDGSLCNALFLSSPGVIHGVLEGDYGNAKEGYTILFDSRNKVPYTNEYTYSIIPKSIVSILFDLSELKTKPVDEVGEKQIAFYAGEKVYVGGCLKSLQLTEANLNTEDFQKISLKKKQEEEKIAKQEQAIIDKQNYVKNNKIEAFSIATDENVYQLKFKSTKMIYNDELNQFLEITYDKDYFNFSYRAPAHWIISLSNGQFEYNMFVNGQLVHSMSDINKTELKCKIISFKYDEKSLSSKFELSDDNLNITHELFVSWIPSSEEYSLVLKSLMLRHNTTEKFSEVATLEKNGIAFFPRRIEVKNSTEDFFIQKKKNSKIQAFWVNEDKRTVNYSAIERYSYYDINNLKISPELTKEIENRMLNKESGQYFMRLFVEETTFETEKAVFEKKRKITLGKFYKGSYQTPIEYYKE
jgi:hypothetical protein